MKSRLHRRALFLCASLLLPALASAASQEPSGSYLRASGKDMQWWRDARFGLFIHWGPVSLKGTEIGKFQTDRPWESCITMGDQWAWKPNDRVKSLSQCVQTLVRCAGGDGNLLLNVGPMPNGQIEARQVARLREMGAWLQRFGHTVYATRGGPFPPGAWGASTHRGACIYLHVLAWPGDVLTLPALDRRIESSEVLTGGPVSVTSTEQGLELRLAPEFRDPLDTIIELRLEAALPEL